MNTMLRITMTVFVAAVAAPALAGGHVGRQSSGGNYYNYPSQTVAPQQVDARRAFSYEPGQSLKAGDTAIVGMATTELKLGDRVLASIPQGTRITVSAVKDNWIGTGIDRNGKMVLGWVLASDLAPGLAPCPGQ
jgi:hypothetical protein